MSIADYSTYVTRLVAPNQTLYYVKVSVGARANKLVSYWAFAPAQFQGAAPTTAEVPTRATTGAFGQINPAVANQLRVLGLNIGGDQTTPFGTLMVCDRLSHQGGLDGTVATAQTTNLPTAALTRYQNGIGVFAALEIYTAIGTSSTTFTVSYTNQGGTSGRTSQATDIGNTDFREVNLMLPVPLQQGDFGIRSVESVTLAATTGTAGNFGVTLFKPLLTMPMPLLRTEYDFDAFTNLLVQMESIVDDACLWFVCISNGNNMPSISGSIYFAED